ncbi:MAG: membrane dipeptidase [Solirubrobacteraceae bacterium]|nr:membrane dipeptidase [Solirubrobacteraceae bacterium]
MLVDLHAHYPMHLIPPERGTHAALTGWTSLRVRSKIVDLLSRVANYEGPGGDPGVTLELMRQGDVGALLSVLYSPFDEMDLSKKYGAPPDSAYFGRLLEQLELVERDILQHADEAQVVRSGADLDACLNEGRIALMHAVEGGFHLGPEADVPANVAELARRGVVSITLAHLFFRGVAANAPALPFLPEWLYRLLFPQPRGVGLTDVGTAAIRAMAEHRVLVDITHMHARAIDDTFALLDELDPARDLPVIASHMACRLGKLEYNMTDDQISRVAARGGLLGVIDCQHYIWDGAKVPKPGSFQQSLERLCLHIDRVVEVTGGFDHAAIGSDLDGYIKPALTGIEHMGRMKQLQAALTARYGADHAAQICSGNALRVLRAR